MWAGSKDSSKRSCRDRGEDFIYVFVVKYIYKRHGLMSLELVYATRNRHDQELSLNYHPAYIAPNRDSLPSNWWVHLELAFCLSFKLDPVKLQEPKLNHHKLPTRPGSKDMPFPCEVS